jgi:riboflavin synthase
MFTGIIEERGRVGSIVEGPDSIKLTINASTVVADATVGDSIAVNGVCLTVVERTDGSFVADAMPETLSRSNLGGLAVGDGVNLERPMAANGRLDGHIVQGHVDGVGVVRFNGVRGGEGHRLVVGLEEPLRRYTIAKGSITIDGASLTIAALTADGVEVALIPLTLELTSLGERAVGDLVNIEVDMVAKYVERMLEAYRR